ncbi:RIP metalloprotease RseP [Novosphingobium album (ex Hu et al. 2023)]|uniref:Zinc metalloprotease n=1 Tax=Novosphingobium album (ex Hu et al. 2023) TaxID=2930093 RepID=A0ABT0AWM4_9SPHN|nr:RIP metalloprotease RseP [Novosphingobium album (ex Hu et al. 2023)]MCJ2177013.1 RIP metalloprotease RseP [Novosphingobium album (ex Hu et al. 2023)]
MTGSPNLLTTIFAFLLVLGPLVLIHELGHYLVGRLFGVKANAFSIGFGKEIAGWTDKRGTRWKLSALPLGGYVQFAGDMNPASAPSAASDGLTPEERSHTFHVKPLWQRALIVFAGPATNLFLAVAIFAAFALTYGIPVTQPVIDAFPKASAAREAGMKLGDRIVAIDGEKITDFAEIRDRVAPFPGSTLRFALERGGQALVIPVTIAEHIERDRFGNEARFGLLGIEATHVDIVAVSPGDAMAFGFDRSFYAMGTMVTGIRQIFTGDRSVKELGGPIKIAKYSGEQFSLGWDAFVGFAALISINLAFINLLPIPGLDGGHLAFYAAELVRRRPLDVRSQEWAIRTGVALVLALMLFVTVNDLVSLPVFGG